MSTEKQIISEIVEKVDDFEGAMTSFMADCAEWGSLFRVRPPKRKSNTFSNPRQTEFFRAASVVGTLTYRMMTAADPFFSIQPVDLDVDYDKSAELKKKYEVTYQHTLVEVSADGSLVKKWSGSPSLSALVSEIK